MKCPDTDDGNGRVQLTRLTVDTNGFPLVDLEYRFSTTGNNGQLYQAKNWVSGEEVTYAYDSLQRLISAVTTGSEWGLAFTYDGFGNRLTQTRVKGTPPESILSVDAATNRINASGYTYDASGNMTAKPGYTMGYNLAGRMTSAAQTGVGTEYYQYGAFGHRVWKQPTSGLPALYIHDLGTC